MKKITRQRFFRSILAVCLICLASTASAYDFSVDNNGVTIFYNITSSKDLTSADAVCGYV